METTFNRVVFLLLADFDRLDFIAVLDRNQIQT